MACNQPGAYCHCADPMCVGNRISLEQEAVRCECSEGGGGRTPQDMLREFHTRFDLDLDRFWPSAELLKLRKRLLNEETEEAGNEISKALAHGALSRQVRADLAKELADVVYVAYGAAVSLGIDLDEAVAIVHRSNMSKLDADGLPIKDDGGKVQKGPHYRPPDEFALARAAGCAVEGDTHEG